MAIHVYREGSTHNVNGVPCEIVECRDVGDMDANIANGCVHDELDLYGGQYRPVDDGESDEKNPIRAAARDAGIENWQTARLKTLQAKLDGTAES